MTGDGGDAGTAAKMRVGRAYSDSGQGRTVLESHRPLPAQSFLCQSHGADLLRH